MAIQRSAIVLTGLAFGLALMTATVDGQERRQASGAPAAYDTTKETTVRGNAGRMFAMPDGEKLMILTADIKGSTLQLILGPEEFVKSQAFAVIAGTAVEVTGVIGHQVDGAPAMLVRQVKSSGGTLVVRDETGRPAWQPSAGAGTRRRQ